LLGVDWRPLSRTCNSYGITLRNDMTPDRDLPHHRTQPGHVQTQTGCDKGTRRGGCRPVLPEDG
ncbi:MAG: hypothetical protein ACREMY_22570, partial [bacterium]